MRRLLCFFGLHDPETYLVLGWRNRPGTAMRPAREVLVCQCCGKINDDWDLDGWQRVTSSKENPAMPNWHNAVMRLFR